jgi:XTP/dITP diphosphohydrolase
VVRVFDGVIEGFITEAEQGGGGFGYDPLFVPLGGPATFAEMTAQQKHALSHRGRAMMSLAEFLRTTA